MPSSHLILCHPLLLLPPIPPSIRVFSNESTVHMRWPSAGCNGPRRSAPAEAQPRGATPRPRSGAATESIRLRRHRSGLEELPHVRGQGRWPRRATACPRSRAAADRSYPTPEVRGDPERSYHTPEVREAAERSNPKSKERWLRGPRRAKRSYSTFKVRRGRLCGDTPPPR